MGIYLKVIRIWAAAAWADGVVTEEEASAMQALIESTPLTPDEKLMAASWIEQPVELDMSIGDDLSDKARLGVYRAALKLVVVDKTIAEAEREFLSRLRQALSIAGDVADDIEKDLLAGQ